MRRGMQAERGREPSWARPDRAFPVVRLRGNARGACNPRRLLSTVSSVLLTGGSAVAAATASQGTHPARHVDDERLSGFELGAGSLGLHAAEPPFRILRTCGLDARLPRFQRPSPCDASIQKRCVAGVCRVRLFQPASARPW